MAKVCPHCGASLPEEAVFCPNCAGSLNRRAAKNPPRLPAARLFRAAGLLALAVILAACVFFYTRPKTYEGTGEVSYTGKNGSYQLLLNYMPERYTPLPKLETVAGNEDSYASPAICTSIRWIRERMPAAPSWQTLPPSRFTSSRTRISPALSNALTRSQWTSTPTRPSSA